MKKFKLYKVGGIVRDSILGIKSKDIDFSFEFSKEFITMFDDVPVFRFFEEMESTLDEEGFKIYKSHPDKFTVKAKFPKDHKFSGWDADIVMCRKETYPDSSSRSPEVSMGNLFDDLLRRDFTVNAMAVCEETDELIDPFNGRKDLKEMILRCPVDASSSFMDDPLRMIRAIRFMVTKGFKVDQDIELAFKNQWIWDKFRVVVSRERVREELFKMFNYDTRKTLNVLYSYIDNSFINDFILGDDIWFKPTLKGRA